MKVFLHPVIFLQLVNFFVEIFGYQNMFLFCKLHDHLNFASSSSCTESTGLLFDRVIYYSGEDQNTKSLKSVFHFHYTYTVYLSESIWNKHTGVSITVSFNEKQFISGSMSRINGIENYHLLVVQKRKIFQMYKRNTNKFEIFDRTTTL